MLSPRRAHFWARAGKFRCLPDPNPLWSKTTQRSGLLFGVLACQFSTVAHNQKRQWNISIRNKHCCAHYTVAAGVSFSGSQVTASAPPLHDSTYLPKWLWQLYPQIPEDRGAGAAYLQPLLDQRWRDEAGLRCCPGSCPPGNPAGPDLTILVLGPDSIDTDTGLTGSAPAEKSILDCFSGSPGWALFF